MEAVIDDVDAEAPVELPMAAAADDNEDTIEWPMSWRATFQRWQVAAMTPNLNNRGVSPSSPSSHNLVWTNKDILICLPHPNLPPGVTIPSVVVALSDLLLHGVPIDGYCTLQDQWLEKEILPHVSKKFETFFLEWQIHPAFHTQLKSLLESVGMSSQMRGMVLFVKNDDYMATCCAGTVIHDICHFTTMPDQCK
jgi:hypothetical protein